MIPKREPLDGAAQLINVEALVESKRVLFSDVNCIAEWIAYRTKILSDKNRLILNNPARWTKYWEVKLAEFEALLSMVGSKEYSLASEIAKSLFLPYLD